MKFSTKLILSFSLILILLVGIAIASYYVNNSIKSRVIGKSNEAIKELEHTNEMGSDLYQSLVNLRFFLEDQYRKNTGVNREETEINASTAKELVRFSLTDFRRHLHQASDFLGTQVDSQADESNHYTEAIKALNRLEKQFTIYESLIEELFKLSGESYQDANEFFTVTIEPFFRSTLIPSIDNFRERTKSHLNRDLSVLNYRLETASSIFIIAFISAFFITVVFLYYLYQSIAVPLGKLSIATKHIGEGNLDERIEISSEDEIGQLATEFNRMTENLSKTTFSKHYVDNIIESMADALVVTDEHNKIEKINSATLSMLGYKEEELLGKPLNTIFAINETPTLEDLAERKTIDNFETSYLTRSGETIPVNVSQALLYNENGTPKGMVCVASDITDRKEAERQIRKSLREKEILLTEIHHRVKNNLAVISGLLQMQIWDTESDAVETALRDSQLMVRSIALVHEKLYQSEDLSYIEFDKYIRDLIQAIMSTYVDSGISININTDLKHAVLNINQAIPCALLINELIVNSHKHAFAGREDGNIWIKLNQENDMIHLTIKDDGSGFPEDLKFEEAESVGMSLIGTFVEQLNGEINISNEDGAVFELSFEREEVK